MIDPRKVEQFVFESQVMDKDFGQHLESAQGPIEVVSTPDCSAINFAGEECQEDYVNTNIRKSEIRHGDVAEIAEAQVQDAETQGAHVDANEVDQSLIDELQMLSK